MWHFSWTALDSVKGPLLFWGFNDDFLHCSSLYFNSYNALTVWCYVGLYRGKHTENLNLMFVHLQAVRSWRENEIRPFAACNHSTDRHGFGCQQFTKATVAALKWLKSLNPSEWCSVGEERGVTPKPLEIVITLPVYTTPNTTPSPSFTVWKTKGWDLIQSQIRFVCVRVCVLFVVTVCWSVHLLFMCVPVPCTEIEGWQHLLQGALMSGSHCLCVELTGE